MNCIYCGHKDIKACKCLDDWRAGIEEYEAAHPEAKGAAMLYVNYDGEIQGYPYSECKK